MGQLVLLVVAAAWAAVLIPPLLRSRIENRPNSSVTDFRKQLSSLQRAVPSRSVGPMRGMARPLAPSPLSRPAASGRPALRSGVGVHRPVRSSGHPTARPARTPAPARMHEATLRPRAHGDRRAAEVRARRQQAARDIDARAAMKRRRANVLFVLALLAASSLFLAATTKATGMLYVFVLVFISLCGYLYLLGQVRQRELLDPPAARPAPSPRPAAPARRRAPAPARHREPLVRRDRSYAV